MTIIVMVLISCENSLDKVKQFVETETIDGVLAYDVVITRSDSGMVVAELRAPLMFSTEGDSAKLEFPKGFVAVMFDDTVPAAQIQAKYGISYEKQQIVFASDSVVAKNLQTNETLYSDTLVWHQKSHKIYTHGPVKITTPDKIIFGDSLTASEDFSKRVIYGIKATLEIEEDED